MKDKTRRRWPRRLALLFFVGVLLVLALGWLAFQRIPEWYRPEVLHPAEVERVTRDLMRTFDTISAYLADDSGPFTLELTQEQLNGWIAIRQERWPQSRYWLPKEISDPYVRIEPGGLRLAVTFKSGTIQTVAQVRFRVDCRKEGLFVQLLDVSGGSLPIPEGLIRKALARLDAGSWPAGQTCDLQADEQPLPPLSGLLEGVLFPKRWIWQNGKMDYEIEALDFRAGVVAVTLKRLDSRTPGASSN